MLVGMLLIAAATSLSEIGTDVSAALAVAPDLAVGDLFGSSMANMAIASVDPGQAVAGVGAILLMALAATAIVHGTETRVHRLEPDAILLVVVYADALFAVWGVRP